MVERSELFQLISDYRPDDPDEVRYRTEMLDLAAAAFDPFDRYQYAPGHFTASGFAIHPSGSSVLLIHHAKLDLWVQPGGHIDPEDGSVIAAARREIEEETGIGELRVVSDGLVDIDIHHFPGTADQLPHQHYDLRFAFVAGSDRLGESEETLGAMWADGPAAVELGVDRSVTRPIEKLLGDLGSGS